MKKILLSAAALAVFLNTSPANAIFDGSKSEMTATFGSNYETTLANADTYANNIKNLLPQLYTAVQSAAMPGINPQELKEAVTEKTFGTSGYLMKYIKKVAELGSDLKNAKSVDKLQTRVEEIQKDGRNTNSYDLLRRISGILQQYPGTYETVRNIMNQIITNASNAATDLQRIASTVSNNGTQVYRYFSELYNEYYQIYAVCMSAASTSGQLPVSSNISTSVVSSTSNNAQASVASTKTYPSITSYPPTNVNQLGSSNMNSSYLNPLMSGNPNGEIDEDSAAQDENKTTVKRKKRRRR